MELNEYIKLKYPDIFEEYQRYLNRENLPKIGDTVKTLVRGFGGLGGQILKIVEYDDTYVTLINSEGDKYITTIDTWYKKIEVI